MGEETRTDMKFSASKIVIDMQKLIIGILLSIVAFFLIQIYFKLDSVDNSVDALTQRLIKVEAKLGIDSPIVTKKNGQ